MLLCIDRVVQRIVIIIITQLISWFSHQLIEFIFILSICTDFVSCNICILVVAVERKNKSTRSGPEKD